MKRLTSWQLAGARSKFNKLKFKVYVSSDHAPTKLAPRQDVVPWRMVAGTGQRSTSLPPDNSPPAR